MGCCHLPISGREAIVLDVYGGAKKETEGPFGCRREAVCMKS